MPVRRWLIVLVASLGACSAPAWAQPPAQPPAQPGTEPGPAPAPQRPDRPEAADRDAVRARMERRLEEARRMQERLEAGMKKLDAGAPLAEVMGELAGEAIRRSGGPGPEGGRAMPGREGGPRPPEARGPDPMGRRERVRNFLRAHMPVIAEQFDGVEAQAGDRLVAWLFPQLGELEAARERDATLFEHRLTEVRARLAVGQAMRDLRLAAVRPRANAEAIERGLSSLRKAMEDQYDARLAVQAREIELLSERLNRLRSELDAQRQARDQTIGRRMGEAEELMRKRREDADRQPDAPR